MEWKADSSEYGYRGRMSRRWLPFALVLLFGAVAYHRTTPSQCGVDELRNWNEVLEFAIEYWP